ncbi:MAG TPA: glycosyltransferase family 4 protein [Rubricoccaceae bacterium]|nr:glycosyltransferase family 4 protein [Rubricoccaceae bacterium]
MRVLFFTPYGGRSGSETVLWHFLKGTDPAELQGALVCIEGGDLPARMPPHIPTYVAAPPTTYGRVLSKARRFALGRDRLDPVTARAHAALQPDLWYLNTVIMPDVARMAIRLGIPYVLHAHEMPYIWVMVSGDDIEMMVANASLVIGCSTPVVECLERFGARNVVLQHSMVDTRAVAPSPEGPRAARRALGIPDDAFVWAMSGRFDYRKGPDLFFEAAQHFAGENAHFLWIGHIPNEGFARYMSKRIATELPHAHVLDHLADGYYDHLAVCDGFVLTSREDPFPLVMLEAAALGKPLVSFPSGGVAEFLQPEMGTVVDSWNVRDLVAAMRTYMGANPPFDPSAARARAEAFSVEAQVPKWARLMRGSFPQFQRP